MKATLLSHASYELVRRKENTSYYLPVYLAPGIKSSYSVL